MSMATAGTSTWETIGGIPFTDPYNLRLEAAGSSLRAYVNNEISLEAIDTSLSQGRYGLVTYKTAADYDVMHVSQP